MFMETCSLNFTTVRICSSTYRQKMVKKERTSHQWAAQGELFVRPVPQTQVP